MTTMHPNPDYKIHREALLAAVNGPFFPDWEFQTIFGLTRTEIEDIAIAFAPDTPIAGDAAWALRGSIGNLIGYPHGQEAIWSEWISVTHSELEDAFTRLIIMLGKTK